MMNDILYTLLFALAGFLIHFIRKWDSKRLQQPGLKFRDYLYVNYPKIIVSWICTCCVVVGGILDNNMTWATALATGYAGDNLFRYLMDRKKTTI